MFLVELYANNSSGYSQGLKRGQRAILLQAVRNQVETINLGIKQFLLKHESIDSSSLDGKLLVDIKHFPGFKFFHENKIITMHLIDGQLVCKILAAAGTSRRTRVKMIFLYFYPITD